MPRLLLIFLLAMGYHGVLAQAIEISVPETTRGIIGSVLSAPITITNRSDQTYELGVRKFFEEVRMGQSVALCLGNECINDSESIPFKITLAPGQSHTMLQSRLTGGLIAGENEIKYVFYNIKNPTEIFTTQVHFQVEEPAEEGMVFQNDKISIKRIFPNPVVQNAYLDYELNEYGSEAKLVIHNILGAIIEEYRLHYGENRQKLELEHVNDGIYFYTLYLDNISVHTNKILVRSR